MSFSNPHPCLGSDAAHLVIPRVPLPSIPAARGTAQLMTCDIIGRSGVWLSAVWGLLDDPALSILCAASPESFWKPLHEVQDYHNLARNPTISVEEENLLGWLCGMHMWLQPKPSSALSRRIPTPSGGSSMTTAGLPGPRNVRASWLASCSALPQPHPEISSPPWSP